MKPIGIGGYFELELRKGEEYHKNAIRLNTGRNALELILRVKKYKKLFVPYFACDVMFEPLNKLNVNHEFYSIDNKFEPVFDYSKIKIDEGFLYVNYFGLKNAFVSSLAKNCQNLIVDNSLSFFSLPLKKVPTFYTCRKFFGVPDGAYLFLDGFANNNLPLDHSENRFAHLLKRIEYGAEAGYNDFKTNDSAFVGQPIKVMSNITKSLLCNIDYNFIKERRINNFLCLNEKLNVFNKIKIKKDENITPLIYPLLVNKTGLKEKLIKNKIFAATYWPNVLQWVDKKSIEYHYATNIIHLPIDQRYGKTEMNQLIDLVL